MFKLNFETPELTLAKGVEIEEIIVPGFNGELNIKPGHAPLMTTLREGVLLYRESGSQEFVKAAISWGYCQVNPGGVNVLSETAEFPQQIDKERALDSLKRVNAALSEVSKLSPDLIEKNQRKARRAQARLRLLE